ncbi:MAG TPA: PA14 domain-containing protein, partial [Clostridia bacterium]|nr:PA14 domain-containing protein [Clostridia bacterium]
MKRNCINRIILSLLLATSGAMAQTVFTPGVLRYQVWTSDENPNGLSNPSRVQIENGQAGTPHTDDTTTLTSFDTPFDHADNFGDRVSGLFIPPVTTNYVFYISADDDADLFLSTDASPENKRLIAQEAVWSGHLSWTSVGSGDNAMRSSATFKDSTGATPFKNGIPLVAGQKYWIEAVHHEGTGGNSLAATYTFVGEPTPANGTATKITGDQIGYGYTIPTSFTVKTQIQNASTYLGSAASFRFEVANPLPDPLIYTWYKNGSVVSNVTGLNYTLLASAADNGAQVYCVVTVPESYNSTMTTTSAVATLTVNTSPTYYTNGL